MRAAPSSACRRGGRGWPASRFGGSARRAQRSAQGVPAAPGPATATGMLSPPAALLSRDWQRHPALGRTETQRSRFACSRSSSACCVGSSPPALLADHNGHSMPMRVRGSHIVMHICNSSGAPPSVCSKTVIGFRSPCHRHRWHMSESALHGSSAEGRVLRWSPGCTRQQCSTTPSPSMRRPRSPPLRWRAWCWP